MSPALRAAVPVACLGYDRISRREDKRALSEETRIARAWKIDGLNNAADMLLSASKRLGAEVEKETKYWEEVLDIRNDGWVVTRMPRERNVLAVRYGFAESAQKYKGRGIGALRRNDDGSVRMDDIDVAGARGRAMLRVRVLKNGELVGTSTQSASIDAGGSVKDMIRRARNFIYEDELFFEIMREARASPAVEMRTAEDSATIQLAEGKAVVLDMVYLASCIQYYLCMLTVFQAPIDDDPASVPPYPENDLAQGIALALRILLSYNHRLALKRRSRPPLPLGLAKHHTLPLQLLRPISVHLFHHQNLKHLTRALTKLESFAVTAGLTASFLIRPLQNTLNSTITGVESAVETFLNYLHTQATVTLPGGWSLGIIMRTALQHPIFGTAYTVGTSHDGTAARLMGENRFSGPKELESYLFWCLERSVVNHIRLLSDVRVAGWEQEAQGNEMKNKLRTNKKIRVEVDSVGLSVTWGSQGGRDEKFVWDGSEKDRTLVEMLGQIFTS
jgi:mediator of RNA polymerase II transcription subunit 17